MTLRGTAPDWLDVSRETLSRLDAFLHLVEKWNPAINLVAPGSLVEGWTRHVLDSAQLFLDLPSGNHWVDLGSGGGFPGIVIAILASEKQPDMIVTLVEADRRKSAFLAQAIRTFGLSSKLVTERIEALDPLQADVLSARALSSLADLCKIAARHLSADGWAIFPKGAQADAELAEARKQWQFDATVTPSHTDPLGRIIKVTHLRHV